MGATHDIIRTEGLVKTFGKGDDDVQALNGLDLQIAAGSVFGLLGANGSGKSTLIRILTTLTRPTAGRAWVGVHDVTENPAAVRGVIGVTGQQTSLDDRLGGAENLRILGRLNGLGRAEARRTADEILARYGLTEAAGRPVGDYSGGMRRRLDIVSGLIRRPPLLFLDEPTTGLDPRSRAQIWDTVRALSDAGTSVFLTTQYLDEADQLADRIAVLSAGELIADGTPQDLKRRIGSRLSVTLADPADRTRAAGALTSLGVGALTGEGALLTGHIDPGAGALPLPELLGALTRVGVDVADIGVSEPTLDEVYLALTEEKE